LAHAGVPTVGEPAILLADELHLGKPLLHELDGSVRGLVVDDDGLVAAHALERLLEPRQRVVRHDHNRDVVHFLRTPSRKTIATPGSASAIVTMKKRNPVANARFASMCSPPRNETKNDSRTARPLIVNGTSMTRKSSGPIT